MSTSTEVYYNGRYLEAMSILEEDGEQWGRRLVSCLGRLEGLQVLDVGCGPGTCSSRFVDSNTVYGIDISEESVKRASERGIHAQVWDSEQALPFPPGTFDLVICREVLEHLVNPRAALENIGHVLKPDGRLWVTVPNHFSFYRRLRILRGDDLLISAREMFPEGLRQWESPHLRYFTSRGFTALLYECGYGVEKDFSPKVVFTIPLVRKRFMPPTSIADRLPDLCFEGFHFLCKVSSGHDRRVI